MEKIEAGKIPLEEIAGKFRELGLSPYIAAINYVAGLGHSIIGNSYAQAARDAGFDAVSIDLVDPESEMLESIMGGSEKKSISARIGSTIYHAISNGPEFFGGFLSAGIRMGARRVKDQYKKVISEAREKSRGEPIIVLGTHPAPSLLSIEERASGALDIAIASLVPDNLSRRSFFGESPVRRGFLPKELDGEVVLVPDLGEKHGYSNIGVETFATGYPSHPEIVRRAREKARPEIDVLFMMGGSGTNGDILLESAKKVRASDQKANIAIYCAFNGDFYSQVAEEFSNAVSYRADGGKTVPVSGELLNSGRVEIYGFSPEERSIGIEVANLLMARSGVVVTKSGERPRSKVGKYNTGGEKATIIIGNDEGGQERTLREYYKSHYAISASDEARKFFGRSIPKGDRKARVEMESEIVALYAGDPSWRAEAVANSQREIANEGFTAKAGVAAALVSAIPLYGEERAREIYSALGVSGV